MPPNIINQHDECDESRAERTCATLTTPLLLFSSLWCLRFLICAVFL